MRYQIDIETLDVKPTALIMSVGICNDIGEGAQIYIPRAVQVDKGRTIGQSTYDWWHETERLALYSTIRQKQFDAYEAGFSVVDVPNFIKTFFAAHDDTDSRQVWMNSPQFDAIVLENFFHMFELETPWHYRDLCDFRTLKKLAMEKRHDIELPIKPKNLHDALADCIYQMEQTNIYLDVLGLQ